MKLKLRLWSEEAWQSYQQVDNVIRTKVAEIVLVVVVVVVVVMAAIIVPGWQSDISTGCVLLLLLCGAIAVVVVVWLDPKDGDDLDEKEDAGIDGRDDAQHLKPGKKLEDLDFHF